MRCEPWMNRAPVPKKTPLEQAQADQAYWRKEMVEAEKRLAECDRRYFEASALVEKLGGGE